MNLNRHARIYEKALPVRQDIRDSARGEDCTMRIPGICNHDPETVVYCHIRRFGIAGTSGKPPEPIGYYGCSACHAHQEAGKAGDDDLLFALMNTLVKLRRKGLL